MPFPRVAAGLLLATLTLGACTGDAVAPERMKAPPRAARAVNPFFLALEGPRDVHVGWRGCTWFARAYGGAPPYTYEWSSGGLTEEASYLEYWQGHGEYPGYFDLTVRVTDSAGQVSVATIGVNVSYNAPFCPG